LLISSAVSTTGDFLFAVALVVYLIEDTGSLGWVAASVIARMAVATALGPIGGVIADRYDRRRLMMRLDLGRAALMVGTCVAVSAGAHPIVAVAITVCSTALATPYRPAAVAATPFVVTEDDLAAANAAEASVGQLAWFAGPAIGSALIAFTNPATAFAVNAGTFLISALLIARIGNIGTGTPSDEQHVSMVRALGEGAKTIRKVPGLPALTFVLAAILFAYGIEQVVQVLVVTDRLGMSADGVGMLNACLGAGGLLAAPFSGKLAQRHDAGRLLGLAAMTMGLTLAALSVTSSPVVAGGLMVIEGVGNIALDVLFITLLQRACPPKLLGRVFSLQDTSSSLAQLVGTIAAPILVAAISLEAALLVGGGSLAVLGVVLLPSLIAMSRRTEAERLRLAPTVAYLGSIGIFGEASAAGLERLARSVVERTYAAGTTVFSEGDPATELFVITSGQAIVSTVEHGEIRRVNTDDWFGEIGLLRKVPRTASIIAAQDLHVMVITGSAFLDAVGTDSPLSEPLRLTMNARLMVTHPHLVDRSE
jgi:MFS family permease